MPNRRSRNNQALRRPSPALQRGSANNAISREATRRNQSQRRPQSSSPILTLDQIAEEGRRPWADYNPETGDPSYKGRGLQGWLRQEKKMMQELLENHVLDYQPGSREWNGIAERISEKYGAPLSDVKTNIRTLSKDPNARHWITESIRYGKPAAHADEKMGLAALAGSGYDDVQMLNSLDKYATDLQAILEGRVVNIDSQKHRKAGDLILMGALNNIESEGGAQALLRSMDRGTPMLQALQQLQSASRGASGRGGLMAGSNRSRSNVSGQEDKLMQSTNRSFNPNPSESFSQNADNRRKDGIIISDYGVIPNDHPLLAKHGKYNATPPDRGMHLVDLEELRSQLNNMSVHDFMDQGGLVKVQNVNNNLAGIARARGHNLENVKLAIPKDLMYAAQGDLNPLAPEILDLLLRS